MVRKRTMTDVIITGREFKILKEGGHLYKWANKHIHNVYVDRREARRDKEIAKLKAKIKELQHKEAK